MLKSMLIILALGVSFVSTPVLAMEGNGANDDTKSACGFADINAKDRNGNTPIYHAAIADNPRLARCLINAGANLNIRHAAGMTALHRTARFNQPEIAKMLLQAGADPNAQDSIGMTPLDEAIFSANTTIIKIIQNAGGKCNKYKHLKRWC